MERTLIMLKGLPASGKSTYAKEMVKKFGYKRVSRDDLRQMIDNGVYSIENEVIIKDARDDIIVNALALGKTVMVDDTNLKPEDETFFRLFAEKFGAEFIIRSFILPVEVCIIRDRNRSNPVGEKIIQDMYDKYLKDSDHES